MFPSPQTRSFRFIFLVPRLFSFAPTIYLSSCTVPLFSFLTTPPPRSSFPPLPSVPLFPSSVSTSPPPPPPSLSFSIFFSSYSYSTLTLTSLMSTVYFHHLAPSPPPPLVYCPPRSTLLEERGGGKNVVHSSTSSKFHESTCFASGTSPRVHT